MKWTAVLLVAILGCLCDAQYIGGMTDDGRQDRGPQRQDPMKPPKQNQQQKQQFEAPITWSFPTDPPEPVEPEVMFELRHPVPAATVAVECRENGAYVEVKKDMFGIGQFVHPSELTLGSCSAVGEDNIAHVLIFETELQGCNSHLATTDDALIYTFVLNYNPRPFGGGNVVRGSAAAVTVECHYPRNHNVSSNPLLPAWIPFAATKVAQELLYFSLKLMTENWQHQRPIAQYFLGDMIYIEATVRQFFHVPLRVFVDTCVATAAPDMSSNPRYQFIDLNGCMVDAKITGSSSKFAPRVAENKLQFQVEAFRFQNSQDGFVFITCHLKATSAGHDIDETHRACSYENGWTEASGVHGACASCDSVTAVYPENPGGGSGVFQTSPVYPSDPQGGKKRQFRDVSKTQEVEWEGYVGLGPLSIGIRDE